MFTKKYVFRFKSFKLLLRDFFMSYLLEQKKVRHDIRPIQKELLWRMFLKNRQKKLKYRADQLAFGKKDEDMIREFFAQPLKEQHLPIENRVRK